MKWLLILASTFYSLAFADTASSTLARAQNLQNHVVMQDGPNCFNTSLYLQGFVQEIVYASDTELQFYLKNFCREKSASALESRDLVTFINTEGDKTIAHSVVLLNQTEILEKSSLMGALNPELNEDPKPGHFLRHDISESLYSPRSAYTVFETVFKNKAYRCQSADQVAKTLQSANKNPAIREQLQFRKELAKVLNISNRIDLEAKILNSFVPQLTSMRWNQSKMTSQIEAQYLQALLRSNAYQMHLLNCSESIKDSGECNAPQLKASTDLTEAWFQKIYKFEKQYRFDKY